MADRINELYQAVLDAKADAVAQRHALDGMLDGQAKAKATYQGLLRKQAAGALEGADATALTEAEAAYGGYEARLSAQRKLLTESERTVLAAEKEHGEEKSRIAAEDARLATRPSRIQVSPPNAAQDPRRGYADHADFLRDVMRAGRTGSVPERLRPLATQGTDEQQTSSNPHGGYFVPVGIAPGVLSVAPELDPLEGLVRRIPMTAPTVRFNARVDKNHSSSVSGGFRVYRRPETVDGTASRAEFEQVTLTANEEFGAVHATEAVIADSPESFIAIIQSGMSDEFVAARMNERINGTGVGERQGILNAACLISVAKETGQAAASIVVENIDKMAARCWRYNQAVWLANHNTRPQLKGLVRSVGTGGQVVPYFITSPNGQETLDGRPIFFTEFAKTLGTQGDLILGNWSEHLDGTYQSEQYAESMHVRFLAAERTFRFYRRNDGQWWWRSALTPKNGDTLSPTVVLATRA